jgi:hypothetical protein
MPRGLENRWVPPPNKKAKSTTNQRCIKATGTLTTCTDVSIQGKTKKTESDPSTGSGEVNNDMVGPTTSPTLSVKKV